MDDSFFMLVSSFLFALLSTVCINRYFCSITIRRLRWLLAGARGSLASKKEELARVKRLCLEQQVAVKDVMAERYILAIEDLINQQFALARQLREVTLNARKNNRKAAGKDTDVTTSVTNWKDSDLHQT